MESFDENIEFDENKVKTKVIVETTFSKEIRIALMRGQNMKEHKTPFPILIHLLDGSIELGVKGKIFSMKKGNIIALEGNVSHDLTANENSIVRLSLSKHDKVERLNDVIN